MFEVTKKEERVDRFPSKIILVLLIDTKKMIEGKSLLVSFNQ